MENKTFAKNVFIIFSVLSIVHTVFYFNYLPERVAIHYNIYGKADSYSDSMTMFIINLSLFLFIISLFTFIVWLIPRLPDKMTNIPNKQFWLDKTRRRKTFDIINSYTLWTGTLTLIFLIITADQSYRSNIEGTNTLSGMFWLNLLLYLFAITYLSIKMYRRFNKLPVDTD